MTTYSHHLCKWQRKLPKEWRGEERKCPCCGRMIYSRMDFAKHGDPRTEPFVVEDHSYDES